MLVRTLLPVIAAANLPDCALSAPDQWYTGSLLSPSGALPDAGILVVEPYLTTKIAGSRFDATGRVRSLNARTCSATSLTAFKYAVTRSVTLQAFPQTTTGCEHGKKYSASFADLPVATLVRVFQKDTHHRRPAISLLGGLSFSTGRYQRLRVASETTGTGAWQIRTGVIMQSQQTPPAGNPLRLRGWATIQTPLARLSVYGKSAYGSFSSSTSISVGISGEVGFAAEYALSRQWVIACDIVRTWSDGAVTSTLYKTTQPSSGDWEVAPAIEYNWSSMRGIIVGAAANYAGHNTDRSFGAQVAVNVVY